MNFSWYLLANLLYGLCSIVDCVIDLINWIDDTTISYGISICLAISFVIDALLYFLDWYEHRNRRTREQLIGCLFNVIGSVLYLIGVVLMKNKTNLVFDLSTMLAFVFTILAMVVFVIESILSFFLPRLAENSSKFSFEFFAHLLYLLANFIYLTAVSLDLIHSFNSICKTELCKHFNNILFHILHGLRVFGDAIYIIDAIFYTLVWFDVQETHRKVNVIWLDRTSNSTNSSSFSKNPSAIELPKRRSTMKFELEIPTTIAEDVEPSVDK